MTEFEILVARHGSPLLAELVIERRRILAKHRDGAPQQLPQVPKIPVPPSLEERLASLEKFVSEIAPYQANWIKGQIRQSDEDSKLPRRDDHPCPSILSIQRAVTRHFTGVSRGDLLSKRRDAPVVHARWVAMYLCRHLTLHSLPEIGRSFGGRDHTTIMQALKKITAHINADAELAEEIEILKCKILERMNA